MTGTKFESRALKGVSRLVAKEDAEITGIFKGLMEVSDAKATIDPVEVFSQIKAERDELEAIVRALAASNKIEHYSRCDDYECACCNGWASDLDDYGNRYISHEPSCPYRRAVEWCKTHPEEKK